MRIGVHDLRVAYDGRTVVSGLHLIASSGEITGLVGPNGGGKSTVLRTVYRHLRPAAGRVLLNGTDIGALPPAEAARHVAALPQERGGDFDLTAHEIVVMGRTPYKRAFGGEDGTDRAVVTRALGQVGLAGYGNRRFSALSCRVANANGPCWPGLSRRTPMSWCWTSRPITSMCATRWSCCHCCGRRGAPHWSRSTT